MMRAKRAKRRLTIAWRRLAVCAVAGLVLATLLGLQAASSVLASAQPALAVRLFPANGLAIEQLAVTRLTDNVKTEADVTAAARGLADLARQAVAQEALTPKAHAVLALAQVDPRLRDAILAAATTINRRDLMVQGLVLDRQIKQGDFDGSLATLDRLLRVHPEQEEFFFPLLYRALKQDAALPAFVEILDGTSEWHRRFLVRAPLESDALGNLAQIHDRLALKDAEFDRTLILQLAQDGDYDRAYDIYLRASDLGVPATGTGAIAWKAHFPPFDWNLAKETGLRSQPSQSGELEVFARAGQGGIVAQRIIRPGSGPFTVIVNHALNPIDQIRDVRLQLRCRASGMPFYDERFIAGANRFEVDGIPAECGGFANLAIYLRAWSSRSQITGTIEELEIRRGHDAG